MYHEVNISKDKVPIKIYRRIQKVGEERKDNEEIKTNKNIKI